MRAQETVFLSPVHEGLCSLVLGTHLWVSTAPCGVEKNGWVIYTLFPGSSVDIASEHLLRHTQMQPTGNLAECSLCDPHQNLRSHCIHLYIGSIPAHQIPNIERNKLAEQE